jgi:hypothetical protein
MAYFSLSGDQRPIPTVPKANGTDGPGITPEFYRTGECIWHCRSTQADPRFFKQNVSMNTNPGDSCVSDFNVDRGILRGQQYGLIARDKNNPVSRNAQTADSKWVNFIIFPC